MYQFESNKNYKHDFLNFKILGQIQARSRSGYGAKLSGSATLDIIAADPDHQFEQAGPDYPIRIENI